MALLEYEYFVLDKYFSDRNIRSLTDNIKYYSIADVGKLIKDNNSHANTLMLNVYSMKHPSSKSPMRFVKIYDLHKYIYHALRNKTKDITKYVAEYDVGIRDTAIHIDTYNVTANLYIEHDKLQKNSYMRNCIVCIIDMFDNYGSAGHDDGFLTTYTVANLVMISKATQYEYEQFKLRKKLDPYFKIDIYRQDYKNTTNDIFPVLPLAKFGIDPIKYKMSLIRTEFYSSIEYPTDYIGPIYENIL